MLVYDDRGLHWKGVVIYVALKLLFSMTNDVNLATVKKLKHSTMFFITLFLLFKNFPPYRSKLTDSSFLQQFQWNSKFFNACLWWYRAPLKRCCNLCCDETFVFNDQWCSFGHCGKVKTSDNHHYIFLKIVLCSIQEQHSRSLLHKNVFNIIMYYIKMCCSIDSFGWQNCKPFLKTTCTKLVPWHSTWRHLV